MTEEQQVTTTRQTTQPDPQAPKTFQKKKAVFRTYHTIWFIVGIIETLLAFRFIFELLAANPASGFTQLIYALSYPFAEPFRSIFNITVVSTSVFDWSLLIAAAVYLIIGYGLVQILRIVKPVTP